MSAKEAKHRFRDSGQEYTEKRMQTMMPVIFFETMEISWLPVKSIKEWADAISARPHMKSRTVKRFRAGLVQLCDFMCSSKTPKNWVCKAPPPVVTAPADKRRSAGNSDKHPKSPGRLAAQTATPRQRPRSTPSADTAQERLQSEQARVKEAILGGVSRDERHRRRLETMHGQDIGMSLQAESSAQPLKESEQPHTAARIVPKSPSAPAESASKASKPADPSDGHVGALSATESESFGRRHTRSKGQAELGATDLDNLAVRKGGPPKRSAPQAHSSQDIKAPAESLTGGGGVDKPAASPEREKRPTVPEVASRMPPHVAAAATPVVDSADEAPPAAVQPAAVAVAAPSTVAGSAVLASIADGAHDRVAAMQPDATTSADGGRGAQDGESVDYAPLVSQPAEAMSERAIHPPAEAAKAAVAAADKPSSSTAEQPHPTSSGGARKVVAVRESSDHESSGVAPAEVDASGANQSAGAVKQSMLVPEKAGATAAAAPGVARRSQRDAPGRKSALELMHGGASSRGAKDGEGKGPRRNSDPKTRTVPSALKCASLWPSSAESILRTLQQSDKPRHRCPLL
jgi:hypothetical protein